jgi:hypothetical protein
VYDGVILLGAAVPGVAVRGVILLGVSVHGVKDLDEPERVGAVALTAGELPLGVLSVLRAEPGRGDTCGPKVLDLREGPVMPEDVSVEPNRLSPSADVPTRGVL